MDSIPGSMWDAGLVSRVRDRKLNEIMIFASMAKIDSGSIDDYIDIIVALGDDIDACDTLLETEGGTEIVLDSIDYPQYLDRLSPGERSDEDAFNSMKAAPELSDPVPEDLADYVRTLISDAVESLKAQPSEDAVGALKDELRIVRARNDELSKELDFRMSECAASSDELKSIEEERDAALLEVGRLTDEVAGLRASLASVMAERDTAVAEARTERERVETLSNALRDAEAEITVQRTDIEELTADVEAKESLAEALETERDEAIAENKAILAEICDCRTETVPADEPAPAVELFVETEEGHPEPAAEAPRIVEESPAEPEPVQTEVPEALSEPPAGEPVQERPVIDRILNDAQREAVAMARAMKDAKIDEFIDRSMQGKVDEGVCDNIVTFLKVDIDICDALLGMDYTDMQSILDGFRRILDIINEAPEPRSQSVYSNSLDSDQSVVEYAYNKVIEHVQDVMLRRYVDKL